MTMRWMRVAVAALTVGCATQQKEEAITLHAPTGTTAAVSRQLEQGNQLFKRQDWQGAKAAYEAAIKADPSLAEAHYNLAMTLERLGDKAAARAQYIQAANLAPGNKVIWDAPPLRKHETTLGLEKKSFMDANPR